MNCTYMSMYMHMQGFPIHSCAFEWIRRTIKIHNGLSPKKWMVVPAYMYIIHAYVYNYNTSFATLNQVKKSLKDFQLQSNIQKISSPKQQQLHEYYIKLNFNRVLPWQASSSGWLPETPGCWGYSVQALPAPAKDRSHSHAQSSSGSWISRLHHMSWTLPQTLAVFERKAINQPEGSIVPNALWENKKCSLLRVSVPV